MKTYDFVKVQRLIEEHASDLNEAFLGMHEDWAWTAETIWVDGDYTQDLSITTQIGGLGGSSWATPTLQLIFKNGTDKMIPCYTGESEKEKPSWQMYGPISGPVQDRITPLSEK